MHNHSKLKIDKFGIRLSNDILFCSNALIDLACKDFDLLGFVNFIKIKIQILKEGALISWLPLIEVLSLPSERFKNYIK
jgi:hypothetical protein